MKEFFLQISRRLSSFALVRLVFSIGRWLVAAIALTSLDTNNFATLLFIISVVEIIKIISDFGLEPFIFLRIGIVRRRDRVWDYICRVKIVISIITFLLVFFVGVYLKNYGLAFCGTLLLTGSLLTVLQGIIQKHTLLHRLHVIAFKASIALFLLGLIVLDLDDWEFFVYALVLFEVAVVAIIAQHVGFSLIRYHLLGDSLKNNHMIKISKILFNKSGYVYLTTLISNLAARSDVILIRPLIGVVAQAQYSAAYRLTEPLLQIIASLILSVLVSRSNFSNIDNSNTLGAIMKSCWYNVMCISALGLAFIAAILSINFFTGVLSSQSNTLFLLFLTLAPIRILNQFHSYGLMKFNLMRVVFFSTLSLALMFGITLLTLLTGEISVTTIYLVFALFSIGEIINFCCQWFYLRKLTCVSNDF